MKRLAVDACSVLSSSPSWWSFTEATHFSYTARQTLKRHSTPVSVNAVSALLCLFISSEMLVAGKSARSAVAALWTAVFCKHSFIGSGGSERLKNIKGAPGEPKKEEADCVEAAIITGRRRTINVCLLVFSIRYT
uniref:Candidate secreted effector n=1 Tax=Meloidogyne incognita TaxID=6306 RepID=A0A914KN56_MELIC